MDNDLLSVDIEKIAKEGEKIYASVRHLYEPKENGKFLAIETDNGKVYLGNTSQEAVERAKEEYPHKVFYIVKIGYDAVETLAKILLGKH